MKKIANSQFAKAIRAFWSDRNGYGVVELMVIIAILGAVGVAVGTVFQDKFPTTANTVGDKVDTIVQDW
ncbi:hypothetical protein ACOBQJ_03305 [Pelotomaculum propionicicum]|uniref:hypothetical protein n=1 Tax=Pelotomaculum propionicicum TaxID=258475 RepID=UPI003B7EF662